MTGQVLDFTGYAGSIRADRGALRVGDRLVPLADVEVILLGQKSSWGYGLIHHATTYDIAVLVCDWTGVPIAELNSPSSNTRVGVRARAQVNMTLPKRKAAWQAIIQSKIAGQARVLELHQNQHHALLSNLATRVRSGDPDNIEGQAAHRYWDVVFSQFDDNFRRRPRYGKGINGMLDYGYTILRGFVLRSVHIAGLQPILGLFHHARENAHPLADDLIEPFRPAVDLAVLDLLEAGETELTVEAKRALVQVTRSSTFNREHTLGTVIESFTSHYASYVEGQQPKLKVPRLIGPGSG